MKTIFIDDDGCFVGTVCKQGLILMIMPEMFNAIASNLECGNLCNEVIRIARERMCVVLALDDEPSFQRSISAATSKIDNARNWFGLHM